MPLTIITDGFEYDLEKFDHPGGEQMISAFHGQDVSNTYVSIHLKIFPHEKFKSYRKETSHAITTDPKRELFLQLASRVKKVLKGQTFAPTYYYAKACGILLIYFILEILAHYNGYPIWNMIALGFFGASIGLNIQHDANHGAISRNAAINFYFGLTQDLIGGSSCEWIIHHIVYHHPFCNTFNMDPDIDGHSMIRLTELDSRFAFLAPIQHIVIWPILFGYGITKSCVETIKNTLFFHFQSEKYPYPPQFKKRMPYTWMLKALFWFRWIFLPYYLHKQYPWKVMFTLSVGGFYLGVFFIISHNFDGVKTFEKSKHNNFFENQLKGSSSLGGEVLSFVNGGLNYQIEHHLFPRISHCHYTTIAPVVKQFCEENDLVYNYFPTILGNIMSSCKRFKSVSQFKSQ